MIGAAAVGEQVRAVVEGVRELRARIAAAGDGLQAFDRNLAEFESSVGFTPGVVAETEDERPVGATSSRVDPAIAAEAALFTDSRETAPAVSARNEKGEILSAVAGIARPCRRGEIERSIAVHGGRVPAERLKRLLGELVESGALVVEGQRAGTRYSLTKAGRDAVGVPSATEAGDDAQVLAAVMAELKAGASVTAREIVRSIRRSSGLMVQESDARRALEGLAREGRVARIPTGETMRYRPTAKYLD